MAKVCTSTDEFNTTIKSGKVVVVDFHAVWCGPCKMISPKFEEFSKIYTDAVFLKVDVDDLGEVAELAGIRAMPTFHVYKNGSRVEEIVGANVATLEAAIKKHAV